MLRLFIAAVTPPDIIPRLAAARESLRTVGADVKWEPDAKLHCTLKFLGDTRDELVPDITQALSAIVQAAPSFSVVYSGLGSFPPKRDPRIIWAGIRDPGGNLGKLAESIEQRLSEFGFQKETRPFHPHVTLGRVKSQRGARELLAMVEKVTFDCPPVSLRTIELIKSDLKPGGSVYSPLAVFALGQKP